WLIPVLLWARCLPVTALSRNCACNTTRYDACAGGEAEALEALLAAATVRTVVLQPPVTTVRVPSPEACVQRGYPAPCCAQLLGEPCTRGAAALPTDRTRCRPGNARPSIPCTRGCPRGQGRGRGPSRPGPGRASPGAP